MYKISFMESSPLGTEAEIAEWMKNMIDLKHEILYEPVDMKKAKELLVFLEEIASIF